MSNHYLQLEPDEQVLAIFRRHWIAIFPIFVSTALLLTAMVLVPTWIAGVSPTLLPGPIKSLILIALTIMGPLSILILVLAYFIHRQNIVRLSNKYYLQITQTGLFNRTVSKLELDQVQDARGTRRGVLGTILNFGEVLIETAGEEQNFFFKPVGRPLEMAEMINDAHAQFGHQKVVNMPDPTP
jgi:uncharacterized membrane protein YdbT with pleckstrin-like domain